MAANVTMTGWRAVDNMLATLEPKLQTKALKKGTRAGAKVVLKKARALVDKGDTLVLFKTLKVLTAKRDKGQKLSKGFIGHAVTHGEKKSVTRYAQSLGLSGKKSKYAGDPYYSIWVNWDKEGHTGSQYISKALHQSRRSVLSENRKAIIKGVNEIAAKERKKR